MLQWITYYLSGKFFELNISSDMNISDISTIVIMQRKRRHAARLCNEHQNHEHRRVFNQVALRPYGPRERLFTRIAKFQPPHSGSAPQGNHTQE